MGKKVLVCLLVLLAVSGCSLSQYIPTKHIIDQKFLSVDGETFSYYYKRINGKQRQVFQLEDSMDVLDVYHRLRQDSMNFDLYYELTNDIQVDQAISLMRSVTAQRTRIFFGESSDFGMIRMESMLDAEYQLGLARVQEVIGANISPSDSDEEKIRKVHDYLVSHTAYDVAAIRSEISQDNPALSVYGTMVLHLAVCEGYARSFLLFMQELGIPCIIIEAQEMNHAWNYVLVDGEWKFIDVTYDDPVPDQKNKVQHEYYLLSRAQLLEKGSHKFDTGVDVGVGLDLYQRAVENLFPQQ